MRMNVKLFAAVVGGSAVVALGVLSVAVAQQSEGQDTVAATTTKVDAPTTTTPVFALQGVVSASPALTGKPPEPPGQVPNRIP